MALTYRGALQYLGKVARVDDVLSLASAGRLLAQLGLTCQKPLSKAFEQNPSLVEEWTKHEYPRINRLAKKERAEIYFSDESGVRSDFRAGTT